MGNENAEGSGEKSNIIKLEHPVQWGDDIVTEVSVRRIKGKDLKGLRNLKENTDDQLKLISRIIGQPTSFVDELDVATDLTTIMERVMDFLPDSQKI